MTTLQSISSAGLVYDHIVGTGGIGSGIFFSLTGNDTLGREESRMATLLPYKDYCKQHIIMHYISVLLGAKINGDFQSYPIGKVGNEEIGKNLINQMNEAGMNTKYVKVSDHLSTLFSVCYQYPDHSGGNITTAKSASNDVSAEDIDYFFNDFNSNGKKEIILAAPEVPVQTRIKLLEYGRKRGSLNVASVLSSEIIEFSESNGFKLTDIFSVNLDEAGKIAHMEESADAAEIVRRCVEVVSSVNLDITLLITSGAGGVHCYSKKKSEYFPSLKVPVISTAGAGDAFLAGCIAGVCCGLDFIKGADDNKFSASPLATATELGILLAALSVTSPDTIHTRADTEMLYQFMIENELKAGTGFLKIFSDCFDKNLTNIK